MFYDKILAVGLSISQINVHFINPTTLTEIHVNFTNGYCVGMHFTSISVTDIGKSEVGPNFFTSMFLIENEISVTDICKYEVHFLLKLIYIFRYRLY